MHMPNIRCLRTLIGCYDMPGTRTIEIYTIDELDKKAKQHAIDYILEQCTEFTPDFWLEEAENILIEAGYAIRLDSESRKRIEYDLNENPTFHASISIMFGRLFARFDERFVPLMIFADIYQDNTGINIDIDGDYNNDDFEKLAREFEDVLNEDIKELFKKIARLGQEEYEAQISDEACLETARVNDYRFTKDGKRWYE